MKYSDWQLSRIRNALRAYHRYERSHDGKYFTWKDVQEAIDEYTGVKVPSERLRQFVEGVNTKEGGRKYPAPKDVSLDAIVKFVTHDDIELLGEDELCDPTIENHAPLRLLEYLERDIDVIDKEIYLDASCLCGAYSTHEELDNVLIEKNLTMQRPMENGCMQVIETTQKRHLDDDSSLSRRGVKRDSIINYSGWAVVTPEDNIMFYLKKEITGRNLYYLTLYLGMRDWENSDVTDMFLLEHEFPFEHADFGGGGSLHAITKLEVMDEMERNIWKYHRKV